jgi:hypothetical protein
MLLQGDLLKIPFGYYCIGDVITVLYTLEILKVERLHRPGGYHGEVPSWRVVFCYLLQYSSFMFSTANFRLELLHPITLSSFSAPPPSSAPCPYR